MKSVWRQSLLLCLGLGVFLVAPALAQEPPAASTVELLALRSVEEQKFVFWQKINQARRDPLAEVQRLELDEAQVRRALGSQAWILDQGLAPLAWNDGLTQAAAGHGRDMIDRVYYSHLSPAGQNYAGRIAATGYDALVVRESVSALVFSQYVDVELAAGRMADMLIRDELLAVPGSGRQIFSSGLTELGISFYAETLPLFPGQPYVYLLIIDYAQPAELREFLLGQVDARFNIMVRNNYTSFWHLVKINENGSFQLDYPVEGGLLRVFDSQGQTLFETGILSPRAGINEFIDLTAVDSGVN